MTTGASMAESTLKPSKMEGVDFTKSPLTEKVKASAHNFIDEIAVKVAKTENDIRLKASSSDEAIDPTSDELKTDMQDYLKKAQQYVKEHPLESIGLAVGAGFLLTRIFKE